MNDTEAFVWDAAHGMRRIEDVLILEGLDMSGWVLHSALGISDDGLTIVGYGTNPAGDTEAWYAVIPEPSTGLLLGLGLAGLVASPPRRR